MPNYKNMSATEAIRHAKEVSGLTIEELAERSRIGGASLRRYFQQTDGYLPGLDKLPTLIRSLGNEVILEWLNAQLMREPENSSPAQSRANILTAVARASASLGDSQRVLAENAEDGVDAQCAREAQSVLLETIAQCKRAYAMLDRQASEISTAKAAPRASLARPAPQMERKKWQWSLKWWRK